MKEILFGICAAGLMILLLLFIGPMVGFVFALLVVIVLMVVALPLIVVLSPWIILGILVWLIFF